MKGRLFRRVTKDLEITSRTSTRLADGSGERPASTPLDNEDRRRAACLRNYGGADLRRTMQRLYGGTRMRNRDGSRGGARLEYPGPSSREEVNRDECGREHPF